MGNGIRIKCHRSWAKNLIYFGQVLYGFNKYFNLGNEINIANLNICGFDRLKNIKRNALSLNLPILERKWKRICLNKISKKEKSENIKKYCFEQFALGFIPLYLYKNISYSKSVIYKNYKIYRESIKKRDQERNQE